MDSKTLLPGADVASATLDANGTTDRDDGAIARVRAGQVAIVVATHKYCFPLDRCLNSFLNLLDSPADLVFVDNGSQGELKRWAEEHFPEITIVELAENRHFCGGYNAGIQHALDRGYDYVLMVNADTEVCEPRFLNRLLKSAEANPDAAFFGPRVFIREEGRVQNTILYHPSCFRSARNWFKHRLFPACPSASNSERSVEFLNGVCVLCRASALRQTGLMDENLAAYVEDSDWHWRAQQRGWSSRFVPVPSIIHHQSRRGYEHYSLNSFLLRRNTVYWFLKRGRRREARIYAFISLALARLRLLRARLRGESVGKHRYYIKRSALAYQNLIRGVPLGDWFGPLRGSWAPPD